MPVDVPASHDLIDAVQDRMTVPVWIFDIDRCGIVWANREACRLWKADSLDELRGRDFASGMSVTISKKLLQYQQEFRLSDVRFSEIWTHYPKGVPRTMRVVYSGIALADGRIAMLCEGGEEIKETPDKLRSAEALVHTSVMITLHDDQGRVLYRNPAAKAAELTSGAGIGDHFVDPAAASGLRDSLAVHGEAQIVSEMRTSQGVRWHEITARHCMDPVTGGQACLWSEVDVTAIKATEAQALHDAFHDPLTKLPNRTFVHTAFERRLQDLLSTSRAAALLFLDLDRFKTVNDSLGHTRGDQLLLEVAGRIAGVVGPRGMAARLGGDEFLILIDLTCGEDDLEAIVGELQAAIRRPIAIGEHNLRLTSSIGVSLSPADGRDVPTLMKHADVAMYEAKRNGRNRSAFFTAALGYTADARMKMEIDLQQDFEDGVLQLFYQPRICVRTGRIVSAEVLLRWPHASGPISPGIFIPLAEDSGLIVQIGAWVLREAARQQVVWRERGHRIKLSVNVSPRQFSEPDFVTAIHDGLRDVGADASDIELEITERLLLEDGPRIAGTLAELKRLGFGISIDDFGTGYSNLAGLNRLPIDCLKIDRSFVADLATHGPIMSLIMSMCRLLKIRAVAEGVETADQLAWLAERDCDEYQGFLYSRAVASDAFQALLAADMTRPVRDLSVLPGGARRAS